METTLYGLNKTGGFKIWIISTDDQGLITIRHGKEGGKLQVKSEQVTIKNIGRSNQTTPGEQAISEANGKIKKQIDKGYRESKSDLTDLPTIAMLAEDYRKKGDKIEFPCFGSDKYDGLRCLAKKNVGVVSLESRTGQPYDVPHIVEQLQKIMQDGDVFDGELYLHDYALQEITSAVKRTDTQAEIDKCQRRLDKAGPAYPFEYLTELEEAKLIHQIRPKLQFHVFDALLPRYDVGLDTPFATRKAHLDLISVPIELHVCGNIKFVSYVWIENEEQLFAAHADAVNRGYEGLMLRNLKGLYESGKRSSDLQKYKVFMDKEFLVIGYSVDKDGCIVFECMNDLTNLPFSVIFGDKEWKKAAAHAGEKYVHKALTVKFQSRYKKTLLPQFPTGVAFREGKWIGKEFYPDD